MVQAAPHVMIMTAKKEGERCHSCHGFRSKPLKKKKVSFKGNKTRLNYWFHMKYNYVCNALLVEAPYGLLSHSKVGLIQKD